VTTAPWTLPAMGSVWTGLYPSVHGATKRSNEAGLLHRPQEFLRRLIQADPDELVFLGERRLDLIDRQRRRAGAARVRRAIDDRSLRRRLRRVAIHPVRVSESPARGACDG